MLTAVGSELAPTVKRLRLRRSGGVAAGGRAVPVYEGGVGAARVAATRTGVGGAAARAVAEALIARCSPARLVFIGFAGGLEPGLATGTVIRPVACTDGGGGWFRLDDGCPEPCGTPPDQVAGPTLLSRTEVVGTPDDKAQLWRESGCAAVDMETFAVAEVAHEHGLPLSVRRVVLDPADASLWPGFARCTAADGSLSLAGLAAAVLLHPWRLAEAWRIGRWARLCADRLADEAEGILNRGPGAG